MFICLPQIANPGQIALGGELGRGHYGVVTKGVFSPTEIDAYPVAIKMVKLPANEVRASTRVLGVVGRARVGCGTQCACWHT